MGKQTYSLTTPCTPVGTAGPMCPLGWNSVGYTQPGSCLIGNVPGDGPRDLWKMDGYQRVCKRSIESSGDLAVDCCGNLGGIAGSVECRKRGYTPYSDVCNNVMVEKCNHNVRDSPYGPQWNGMPFGQTFPVFDGCTGKTTIASESPESGCLDRACVAYLRDAPPGNFFRNHDYIEYPHHFPRHSYTTSALKGGYGYQPMRMPYAVWNDYNHRNRNTFNE